MKERKMFYRKSGTSLIKKKRKISHRLATRKAIYRIGTKSRQADILTKGPTRFPFEQVRFLVMGW